MALTPKERRRRRALKGWRTRRKRYGKDGVMDTKADARNTFQHIRAGTQRRRPATHYYQGDQIKPFASKKQWRRTVVVDVQRPGTKYEVWERMRVQRKGFPKGLDRYTKEWAHLHDVGPRTVKILKRIA